MAKWITEETSFKLRELSKRMPRGQHNLTTTECGALIKELFAVIVTLSNDIDDLKNTNNEKL